MQGAAVPLADILAAGQGIVQFHQCKFEHTQTMLWVKPGERGIWVPDCTISDGELVQLLSNPRSTVAEGEFVRVRRLPDAGQHEGWTKLENVHSLQAWGKAHTGMTISANRTDASWEIANDLGMAIGSARLSGLHFAKVTVLKRFASGFFTVGVVQAGYDPSESAHASRGHLGWCWGSNGRMWHNAVGEDWEGMQGFDTGDVLTLRLNITTGTLAVAKNNVYLGVVASNLPNDEYRWCFEAGKMSGQSLRLEPLHQRHWPGPQIIGP
jgi:hypothetical protein